MLMHFMATAARPWFVTAGGIHGQSFAGEEYFLIGIISGYYPEGENYSVPAATVLTGNVHDNSGIATVVPAYELRAVLDSPALKALRDAAFSKPSSHP
jgi:hypothetical protein